MALGFRRQLDPLRRNPQRYAAIRLLRAHMHLISVDGQDLARDRILPAGLRPDERGDIDQHAISFAHFHIPFPIKLHGEAETPLSSTVGKRNRANNVI